MKKLFITTVLLSLFIAAGIEAEEKSIESDYLPRISLSGNADLTIYCDCDCIDDLIGQLPKYLRKHSKTRTRNDIYWEPAEKSGRMRYYYTIKKIPVDLDDTIEEIDGVDAAFCNLPRQLEVFKVPHARWSDIHPIIIEKLKEATR